MMHATLDAARTIVRNYTYGGTTEDVEAVAAYAFEKQTAVYHAAWAVALRAGKLTRNATCSCRKCERDGSTARIDAAGRRSWSAWVRENGYHSAEKRAANPEWYAEANAAALKAATAEALAVLAELEAAA